LPRRWAAWTAAHLCKAEWSVKAAAAAAAESRAAATGTLAALRAAPVAIGMNNGGLARRIPPYRTQA